MLSSLPSDACVFFSHFVKLKKKSHFNTKSTPATPHKKYSPCSLSLWTLHHQIIITFPVHTSPSKTNTHLVTIETSNSLQNRYSPPLVTIFILIIIPAPSDIHVFFFSYFTKKSKHSPCHHNTPSKPTIPHKAVIHHLYSPSLPSLSSLHHQIYLTVTSPHHPIPPLPFKTFYSLSAPSSAFRHHQIFTCFPFLYIKILTAQRQSYHKPSLSLPPRTSKPPLRKPIFLVHLFYSARASFLVLCERFFTRPFIRRRVGYFSSPAIH